jgi:hypothetical protein
MKVYVVMGRNDLTHEVGPVAVATTRALAEQIEEEKRWRLDESVVLELDLVEDIRQAGEAVR